MSALAIIALIVAVQLVGIVLAISYCRSAALGDKQEPEHPQPQPKTTPQSVKSPLDRHRGDL